MRNYAGPQFLGDGVDVSGAALSAAEKANLASGGVRKVVMYNAGPVAIAVGDAVALVLADTTIGAGLSVEQLDVSDAAFDLIVGGAAENIPVGARGEIIVEGVQAGANVATGTAAGVVVSGGAADGRLAVHPVQADTAAWPVGPKAIVLVTAASNQATVRWLNPLNY